MQVSGISQNNMNALEASSTLSRPRAPRNISFGSAKGAVQGAAANPSFFKRVGQGISNAAGHVGGFFRSLPAHFRNLGGRISRGFSGLRTSIGNFIETHKGIKGVKAAAIGATALIAAAFAVKEVHDIVTKSNPEN